MVVKRVYRRHIMKTNKEIDEVLGEVAVQIGKGGSKFSGMTYEEGVDDALRWVQGDNDSDEWPFGDEE
jgi:hypothetical protein